ncbi:hypothetical protein GCM10027601_25950 [Nocardioides ungokensis]
MFPARVNVHSVIDGTLLTAVNEANGIIYSKWDGEILFEANGGRAIPHVTMLMGEVESAQAYDGIVQELARAASVALPATYGVGLPYLVSRNSGFIFVDVLPSDLWQERRLEIAGALGKWMKFDRHGGPRNVSHITLGYARTRPAGVSILAPAFAKASGADQVWQTSLVGDRGTAIKALDTFRLGGDG